MVGLLRRRLGELRQADREVGELAGVMVVTVVCTERCLNVTVDQKDI